MTEPSGRNESWEQRAAGLAGEIQRRLIRASARNMRDELGGQVKKAFRGSREDAADAWATATTEPPHAADEPPECAWCPLCRTARLIAHARAGTDGRGGPRLSDAADMMAGAMRDALAGLDAILSYRPREPAQPGPAPESPGGATPQQQQPPAGRGRIVDAPVSDPPVADPAETPAVRPADSSEST
jgi:hypothetical protein